MNTTFFNLPFALRYFLLHERGFTLVELMVVILCLMLVITPAMRIFQQSTSSSLSGMLHIDTTLEGRRVIRQIHNDLKMACFSWYATDENGNRKYHFTLEDVLVKHGFAPLFSYSFYCFPHEGAIETSILNRMNPIEEASRLVSKITYKLERPNPKEPMKLFRIEKFHPNHPEGKKYPDGIASRLLSSRVNFFRINIKPVQEPAPDQKDQWFFWITLQLKEGHQRPDVKGGSVGEILRERSKGVILADFYDVVYPEFFHAFYNYVGMLRNWHTEPIGP